MDKIKDILCEITDEESWKDFESYISSISTRDDALEYLQGMLDMNNEEHKNAIEAFLEKFPDTSATESFVVYNKYGNQMEENMDSPKKSKKKSKQQMAKEKYNIMFPGKPALPTKETTQDLAVPETTDKTTSKKKGRQKYVALFSGDATKVVMLPGRNKCECCATKHQLVNNCLSCGRIVCLQEGSGPCMTCGELVCSKEELAVLNRGSKKSEQLRSQLLKQGISNDESHLEKSERDLVKAEEYKARLLDFDKTSARRTRVIDDEMDYFQADSTTWLSPTEREKLKHREDELRAIRNANKRRNKVSFDFVGSNVVMKEDNSRTEEFNALDALYGGSDDVVEEISARNRTDQNTASESCISHTSTNIDPNILTEAPIFVKSATKRNANNKRNSNSESKDMRRQVLRNQDAELRELRDEGYCLSMHQPWASLLVRGIKTDEGRTWYSPHRGRLWIAATSKPANPEEVKEQEATYRALGTPSDAFPTDYPTGCLLGCVDVIECLPQADYKKEYPDGESLSPFVFVCCNPQELLVKFPISGRHKIYRLDPHVHEAAKKGIERASEMPLPG